MTIYSQQSTASSTPALARGNCTKTFTRFYYDSTTEHCFKFVYTGCKGNGNRFLTKHQCKQRCSPNFWKHHKHTKLYATLVAKDNLPMTALSNISTNSQHLAEATGLQASQLECDQQNCNSTTHGKCVNGKCRCFKGFEMRNRKCVDTNECHWVECGPNSICVNIPGSFRCECRAGYAGSGFNCTTNPAVCQQPFDKRYEKQEFWYGGCQFGNHQLNFFSDLKTCQSICNAYAITSQPAETHQVTQKTNEPIAEVCLDAFDNSRRLPCSVSPIAQLNPSARWSQRFYFDHPTKKCKLFWYDSICQQLTAADPLSKLSGRKRKSRNVKDGYKLAKVSKAENKTVGSEINVKLLEEESVKPNLITAYIGSKDGLPDNLSGFISDECLDKFDHNLKRACSRGRFPWSPRYYYDVKWKRSYCKWKCESSQTPTTATFSVVDGKEQARASCLDTFDSAYSDDCQNGQFTLRYYFNHNTKHCSSFQYGGCPASPGKPFSRNMFSNYEDCLQLCEIPTKSMSKACSQPLDKAYRRPCENHNLFSQYYYYDQKQRLVACFGSVTARIPRVKTSSLPSSLANGYAKKENNRNCQHTVWNSLTTNIEGRAIMGSNGKENTILTTELDSVVLSVPALSSAPRPSDQQMPSIPSTYNQPFSLQDSLRCLEPLSRGNCQHELPAYFYNKHTKQCEPFSYTGCLGNGNRFLTLSQCQGTCGQYSQLSSAQANCILPLNVGFGRQNMSCIRNAGYRFYYNPQYDKCGRFWYFGCGGNENALPNYAACDRLCQGTLKMLSNNIKTARAQRASFSVEACFMQPNEDANQTDSCSLEEQLSINYNISTPSTTKWTYNISKKACHPLEKTPCFAESSFSDLLFDSLGQCTSTCSGLKVPKSMECARLPDWGECNQLRYMWYYNLTKGICEQFLWGGCGGNSNRFASFELCQLTCELPNDDICSERLDRGQWCESMTNRFYYHPDSKTCKGFHYTGCGKSRNNFKSQEDCEQRCIRLKHGVDSDFGIAAEMKSAETTIFVNGTKRETLTLEEYQEYGPDPTLYVQIYLQCTLCGHTLDMSKQPGADSGTKPLEKLAIQRHHILMESALFRHLPSNNSINSYVKAEGQFIDYGYCTGYRYNISGAFTRLTSYMCLMEEGGTCQVHTLWDTGGDENVGV
uniref:Papilin n=1 Tax=Ditylenchus dipsaci TaxID=166011 RepID=A0A915D2G2_9BILA